ncbi:MAG TPA: ABC transporter substrate-binding protein [Casimicrobiaceae bacterium]|nr:ABC transporter substrate-binding protein [Casimicrobiaceae bacterium]
MNRREATLLLVALAAVPCAARAQQAAKIPRVGYLASNLAGSGPTHLQEAFLQGLRDLDYIDGRNIVIEYRDAQGKLETLPTRAAELVALKVDVIFAPGTQHALAAQQATKTIPIVFADIADPMARGLVTSLARPGGNITGLANLQTELVGKWLELLKQALPRLNHVAFLWEPTYLPERAQRDLKERAEAAAKATGVRLEFVAVRTPDDFDRAFSDMMRTRADAVIVWGGVMFIYERRRIAELAAKNQLPGAYTMSEFVDAGGLMSYSPNIADNFRRAAGYVDKILKGAKPADLPVEQPTKFELVINLRTAKTLGLTIPPSVLHRADRLIE